MIWQPLDSCTANRYVTRNPWRKSIKVLVILSLFLGLAMFGPGLLTGGATAYAEQADDPTPAVAEEKPASAAAEACPFS
ncbi:MAG: hypothetical protein ABIF77_07045 [bacterium]